MVCLQSLLAGKLSPWGLQRLHPWSSSVVCLQSLLVDKLSPWGLQCLHPWSSSVVCLQSLLVDKLSPWGLQRLQPRNSSMVDRQVVTVGSPVSPPMELLYMFAIIDCEQVATLGSPVSPPLEFNRSIYAIIACGQVVALWYACNHCLWTRSSNVVYLQSLLVKSCLPGVSSVSTPGVPAWCVCNHCLWTGCHPGVSSVSIVGVPAWYIRNHCLWKVVSLGSPASPLLEFQRGVFAIIACGQVVTLVSPVSLLLEFQRGIYAIIACGKLSPWVSSGPTHGVPGWYVCNHCLWTSCHRGVSSVFFSPLEFQRGLLPIILGGKLSLVSSFWSSRTVYCNHCLWISCHGSSVSPTPALLYAISAWPRPPGVAAWQIFNNRFWTSCPPGVSSVSTFEAPAWQSCNHCLWRSYWPEVSSVLTCIPAWYVCNHCLWTRCHPGVSSVSTPGVPAWYVCNHCLWTSCKLSPWGLQCPHPWSSSVVCLQSLLVDKLQVVTLGSPVCPPLESQRGMFAIISCGVSSVSAYGVSAFLFITCGKLSPWGLQCLHPSISSVVCLQSLLVDKLSSWGLQRLRPCREFQRGMLAISLVNNLSPRNFQ